MSNTNGNNHKVGWNRFVAFERFISNVGFPITIAFVLLFGMFYVIRENTDAIRENSEVIRSLEEKIQRQPYISIR